MVKDPNERLAFASSPFRTKAATASCPGTDSGKLGVNERGWECGMTGKKKKDQRPWQAVGLRLWAARLGIQRTVKDKPEIKADWAWAKTQTSFAKTVGSYRQQLSRYEKGYDPVSLPVLINIRKRTGVPTDWVLVGLTEMIPGIFRENILKCYESLLRGDPDC